MSSIPSVTVRYAQDGSSTRSDNLGMRPMQERFWQKRGEQYLLIKSPPASGKSRALIFVALDKAQSNSSLFKLQIDLRMHFCPPMDEFGKGIVLTRTVYLPFPPFNDL